METDTRTDSREYLAAERTLLSYVRTAMAMIGLGFVIARFGLLLQELDAMRGAFLEGRQSQFSVWVGTGLVFASAAITVLGALQYRAEVRHLNLHTSRPRAPSWLAISISLLMSVVGVGVGIYLLGGPGKS